MKPPKNRKYRNKSCFTCKYARDSINKHSDSYWYCIRDKENTLMDFGEEHYYVCDYFKSITIKQAKEKHNGSD